MKELRDILIVVAVAVFGVIMIETRDKSVTDITYVIHYPDRNDTCKARMVNPYQGCDEGANYIGEGEFGVRVITTTAPLEIIKYEKQQE